MKKPTQLTLGDPYASFNKRVAEDESRKNKEFLDQLRRNKKRGNEEPLTRSARKRFKSARSVPGKGHEARNHMGQGELFEVSKQTGIRRRSYSY